MPHDVSVTEEKKWPEYTWLVSCTCKQTSGRFQTKEAALGYASLHASRRRGKVLPIESPAEDVPEEKSASPVSWYGTRFSYEAPEHPPTFGKKAKAR